MNYYQHYRNRIRDVLDGLEITDRDGRAVDPETGLADWSAMSKETARAGGHHFFAGNGASAMMASHMAVDCTKNGGFNAMAFNDAALLTAVGNDIGYDAVFSYPLNRYGKAGDVFITISSSGNSPNIVNGLKQARDLGLKLMTLSGMKPDNQSRRLGDLNFWVPGLTYGMVECAHQILLHCWLDQVMDIREWDMLGDG